MLTTLKYNILKRDPQTRAKVVQLINPLKQKEGLLTGVFFDVRSTEDFKFMKKILGTQHYKLEYFRGMQIPLHYLPKYGRDLLNVLPASGFLVSDLCTEVLYTDRMISEKMDFYHTQNLFPEELRATMKEIQQIKNPAEKLQKHTALWKKIVGDKKLLQKMISNFVRVQMRYGLDFIGVPAPIILDKEHLEVVEACYAAALNMYAGALDIENEQGKMLTLYLNISKHFLKDKNNAIQILQTIKRLGPKAVAFKICDLEDIRQEIKLIEGWVEFVKGLGIISNEDQLPTIYLSAGVAGMVAQAHGIDCFTQSFYKEDNVEREFMAPKAVMRQLWKNNAKLTSGRISVYEDKNAITRLELEGILAAGRPAPYPMPELPPMDYAFINSMSPPSFREFAKLVLVLQRNFEESEIKEGIENLNMRFLKGKFKRWLGTSDIFP